MLDRYTAAERLIRSNLAELEAQPTYVQLTASLGPETEARIGEAMRRSGDLWNWSKLLAEVLDEARSLVAEGRLSAQQRQHLVYLVTGPSVLVGMGHTPLDQRDLLGESSREMRLGVGALIDRMRELYEPIRDAVADVEAIWRELLPRIDAAGATVDRMRAQVEELGITAPLVDEVVARLDELRRGITLDPLAVSVADGDIFESMLARAVEQVAELRRGHDQIDADLESVESTLSELRSLRALAAAALSETQAKIVDHGQLIRVPSPTAIDGPGGLADRADGLRSSGWGPWTERRGRIDEWLALAARFRSQLDRALETNRGPLKRRSELRGLLRAYRAKGAALGTVEDPELTSLADEAHNELHTAPTDLDRAAKLVSDLGSGLRGAAPGSGR